MSRMRRPDGLTPNQRGTAAGTEPSKPGSAPRPPGTTGPVRQGADAQRSGAGSPRSNPAAGPYSRAFGTVVRNRAPIAISDLLERALGSPKLKDKAEEYAAFPFWDE